MPVISAVGNWNVSLGGDMKKGARESSPEGVGPARPSRHATCTPRGARGTLPALRQRVQTFTFVILPSTRVRTTWRFGVHVRRVLLFAWDTLLPNATPLSQLKQLLRAMAMAGYSPTNWMIAMSA